ncbi:MAG: efflux RND transporter permease subunit, partial [Burkholderiales bacterium]|nr:efflux RND transporter permease subunit [Burkholderiales bacterium]
PGRAARLAARLQRLLVRGYRRSLAWTLRHQPVALISLLAVIALNVDLYATIPKTFFPQQDVGAIIGGVQADQSSSYQMMEKRVIRFNQIVAADPAVQFVSGGTGFGGRNTAFFYITLKPLAQRKLSADAVIARLRGKLAHEPGARLFMFPVQDIRIGGRPSNSEYQYTLQADDNETLREWEPRVRNALMQLPEITDVDTDQADHGLQTSIFVDRDAAARLGVTMSALDTTLGDAFGQRQVGVIYNPLNQYRIVMELDTPYLQGPASLDKIYVNNALGAQQPLVGSAASLRTTSGVRTGIAANLTGANNALFATRPATSKVQTGIGANRVPNGAATNAQLAAPVGARIATSANGNQVPLSAFARVEMTTTPLSIGHQGGTPASTISFNLPLGVSLSQATTAIDAAMKELGVPVSLRGSYAGTANAFQQSLASQPLLILAAILTIYLVLGILYESLVHPVTILSTLPSAGVGALLALMLFNTPFSIIALIGVILLIGIVKKNAIMMIDFALEA